ncbi:septum formation family protein [Nocardioides gilvus]|uniref:septum formation family protein n=1 Tax=Nocardioides gilvus TaxID=1735589 RepID=UPI000D74C245|nr:septum formation family protein [Nocardioides gilvus]
MRHASVSALACLTMLFGLSACTDEGNRDDARSTSTQQTPEPAVSEKPKPPRRPKVGDCHRLTWNDALAPTAPVKKRVGCAKKPTAVTFYVGRVKRDSDGTRLAVDAPSVQKQVARVCPDRLQKHLGGNKDLLRRSLLTTVWFTPTIEQEEAGADWFRCDLVAPLTERTLLVLQTPVQGLLDDPGRRERYALCASGDPGSKSFKRTTCRGAHAWRAVSTVDISGEAYPGAGSIETTMDDACSDVATEEATNPLDVRWSQEGPTRKQWKAGRRYGICWVPA